jgi:hypothetical protein
MRLDTDDRRKSHYFFCDIRKNAHKLSIFPPIIVEKETTGGSIPCDAMPPVKYFNYCCCLSQAQRVQQGPANRPVYRHAIPAFKSRDGATSLGAHNSVDYAVVVTESAKTPLHSRNH